ncbi:hypothetical protein CRG98_011193 [Punica granatum]|uniref:Reverse transcriptase zinc-binding domain-containing protein n=1 Tax=Punica granatum TaxID=22663 RepID=A0A2I0KKR0_PUNGR|nr:hypothetical protein CRG98_011193 [Punica granatum]
MTHALLNYLSPNSVFHQTILSGSPIFFFLVPSVGTEHSSTPCSPHKLFNKFSPSFLNLLLSWTHLLTTTKNGDFSTSSTYILDQSSRFPTSPLNQKQWRALWRLNIHDKHKLLLWKLVWNCFPTASVLASRFPVNDFLCPFRNSATDHTDHLFIHCPPFTSIICATLDIPSRVSGLAHSTMTYWIKLLAGIEKSLNIPSDIQHMFLLQSLVCLDYLWQLRNSLRISKDSLNLQHVTAEICRRSKAYEEAWLHKSASLKAPQQKLPSQLLVFSFDVALRHNASYLAIACSDGRGNLIYAWSFQTQQTDPTIGEQRRLSKLSGVPNHYISVIFSYWVTLGTSRYFELLICITAYWDEITLFGYDCRLYFLFIMDDIDYKLGRKLYRLQLSPLGFFM